MNPINTLMHQISGKATSQCSSSKNFLKDKPLAMTYLFLPKLLDPGLFIVVIVVFQAIKTAQAECLTPLGMESGKITDGQVTASSYFNGDDRYAPKHGRLNKVSGSSGSLGAWAAGQENIHQWIQVDLGVQNMAVTRVATQGRNNDEERVKSYKLQYSNNMVYFQYYREAASPLIDKVFDGNRDSNTVVYHDLNLPISARYIRFQPTSWFSWPSMRVELYGCPQECKAALGMENGKILDGQISASSEHSSSLAAIHGRLHYQGPQGNDGAWAASANDFHQWLQIDLGSQFFKVKGVATQSRQNVMQYVTKYKLQYSNNGLNFKFYREEGSYENKLFIGNSDKNNVVSHDLNPPIRARFIRFRPREWFDHISMRVELYGCQVCRDGLGMESGAITDGQISASSEWEATHSAAQGRLNLQPSNDFQGCWSAALNDGNQWLKVDLGTVYTAVTRVATQGRNGTSYRQWVTKYKLQYSDDGENFKYYTEEGQNTHKVFTGNTDRDTVVSRDLYPPIRVRYIRFRPVSWEGHISMRVELYGCQECQESLGVETKKIPDDQLTASSKLNDNLAPKFGRLYLEEKLPHQEGSWAALHNDTNQWLQVDVGSYYVKVTRVATQGRNGSDQWVTQYRLQYGDDVANLQRYKEYNQDIEKVFDGNTDADTVVSHDLVPPIRARYVRFLPGGWHIHISMRVDLYGCEECQEALGMENGVILDEKITASSQYAERTGPARARLYIENTFGTGGWVPTLQDANPWLQIDLVSQYRVTHVATQGRYYDELSIWVIKYKLIYRSEGEYFKYYMEEGQTTEKEFDANTDKNTVVFHELYPGITARYIRFYPTLYKTKVSMRVEIYGCPDCQVVAYYSIKSPRYPKDYPGNMDCVYEIPILHYKALTFTFQDFHLEESSFCSTDYLKISNEKNQTFGTFCGQIASQAITVTGEKAIVAFHSDYALQRKGFRIYFTAICEPVVKNTLRSPGYPSNYTGRHDCVYKIPIPRRSAMNISFIDFSLEFHNSCSYDYLTIANDTNHVFGKFCGEKTGKTFIVTGRFLLITFHTDYVVESRGFDINFNPVPLVHGRDCLDLLHKGYTDSGVYGINPDRGRFITVFCDQQTNGGGWTVLQQRLDGSVDFYRNWTSYKNGFGDLTSEFWLGNDNIHKITSQSSQLLIELKDQANLTAHASYNSFQIGLEAEKYVVRVTEFSGTAGDSLAVHNGMMFSTPDSDNDVHDPYACAQKYTGAWWYKKCHQSNLNGRYGINEYAEGVIWYHWKGYYHSLKESSMKVKPRRERQWSYELIFSGELSDYVLLPYITDLQDATACWWMKTEKTPGWSTVFSLHNYKNESLLSFSFHDNGSYSLHVHSEQNIFNVQDEVLSDGLWHHMCIARSYSDGKWTFYSDGVEKLEGVDLGTDYSTGKGFMIIGKFRGNMSRFNMWDEYIDDVSRIEKIAHACSSITGNVVPWSEVYLWRRGTVLKENTSVCNFFEVAHWDFRRRGASNSRMTYDLLSSTSGVFNKHGFNRVKGMASLQVYENLAVSVDVQSECLGNQSLCHQGLSLGFWLRHKPRFITTISGYKDEYDNLLGKWLDAILPKEGAWLRCFKASSNWKGTHFHSCDGLGPTVTFIRVQKNIFGGFLCGNWGGADGYIKSNHAFIFTLKNLRGIAPFKMDLKSDKSDHAATQSSTFGPIFGENDINVHSLPAGSAESFTSLNNSYKFPSSLALSIDERDSLLAGSKYFIVDDLEAFYYAATSNELGLRKRTVSDSQLSASSSLDDNEAPGRPEHAFFDNKQGSWCSYTNGANEWLELDLGTDQTIYGVAVQGSHDSNAEVTLYKIGMRVDGSLGDSWLYEVTSNGSLNYFYPNSYTARYVRFTVIHAKTASCMRVGVLKEYCLPDWKYFRGSCYFFSTTSKSWEAAKTTCVGSSASLVNIGSKKENDFIAANTESERWIGLKEIPGNKMNWTNDHTNSGYVAWKAGEPAYEVTRTECASLSKSSGNWYTVSCDKELDFICEKAVTLHDVSYWSTSSWKCMTEPRLARLHEWRNCHASWCGSVGAWLQIDLGRDYDINGINTQGARDNYGFVKKFTLAYKTTSGGWENFEEDGNVKEFVGNVNGNGVVKQTFLPPFKAHLVKFNARECNTATSCCMRVEIYISARCPSGWEYFQGSCYWFSDHSQPQSHAVNTCRVRGADLPKVTSIEENNFLKKSGYSWWLDLRRDSTHKSIFRWSDGSLADFTNWKSGDHSDNSKECVEQEDTGEWNTVLCTTNRKIACKKENIDVILATGTVSKRSAGIVFGFQEFTQTYHLSVSAGPHIWEARLPDYPLGWVHVGITWSNQWGLRFYQNGVLTVESTSPARLLYATESTFPRFYIGRESTTFLKRTHNLQISDLRIWESVIPPEKMEDMQACSALPWYMWKNTGNYDYPWELKRVPRESPDEQRFDVIPQDTKYHNMGCFKIGSGPPIPSLEGTDPILTGNHVSRLDAVQKCLHAARRKGNKMFAVASGGKCLSAAVEYSDVEKSYTETSHGCKKGKGATNYMNIYIVKESNNAAFKKPTAQSGTIKASSFATDGSHYNINTEKCTKTTSQKDPWWRVDLEREVLVHDVYIYKHSYVSENYLLQIRVGNHDNPNLKKNSPCGGSFRFKQLHWKRIRCPSPLKGRFVSITRIVGNGILKLCEVEVREEATDYVQASMSYPRQRTTLSALESIYLAGTVNCLSFHYNMSGENASRLNIFTVDQENTISLRWRLVGDQGNQWKFAQVTLNAVHGFKIKFEALSDGGIGGKIGIRNIKAGLNSSCTCIPTEACPKITGFHSAMISHAPSYQDMLMKWLSEAGYGEKYWVPCYRAHVNGWQKLVFHRMCDNRGPSVTIARIDSFVFGGFSDKSWKSFHPYKVFPSSNAFLFSLKPFSDKPKKLDVLLEKRHQALHIHRYKGPCWGEERQELCFNDQNVATGIIIGGVFNVSGITDATVSKYFTGQTSFQADDLQVFVIGDSLCDPPCWEGESCDEIAGKCICDPTRREEEMCRRKQELRQLRDKSCKERWEHQRPISCSGRLFARYDIRHTADSVRNWRCYYEDALIRDRSRYDTIKRSNCYHTDSELESFTSEDAGCRPLGMESGSILDSQITGSSEYAPSSRYGAPNARLNNAANAGAWAARSNDVNQWLQIDFLVKTTVAKVATQGRKTYPQWVKSYSLSHSLDGTNFEEHRKCGTNEIFNANWDENTVVYNTINPVIFARYIRVMPKTWKSHISMRVEFYDCGGSEYNVFKADELLSQAEYVWTFDHLNDIKDLPGKTWAERSALLQSTTGVRGRAVSTAGGAGPIRLHDDSEKSYLVWPLKSAQVTVALWLLYHSKVPPDFQTFLASAEEVSGGRGIHLFQMDGSKEELTFRVTVGNGRCFVKFHAPQGVWTHWVFTWKKVNNKLSEDMTVYRNGKAVDDLLQNTCEARNYPEITNFDFTIGSHTLPKASFDDIIVWLKLLSTSEVEELFSYYEGRANLHVNVSLELTDEEFNLEYRNITSEIFKHTSTWIESQVMSLHQNNSLLSVDNFVFWNVTNVAANFTVRFKGTECREIEPLQTSLVSQSMLGNRPIRLLSKLTANDIYIHSLHVTAQNKSSTSLAVSWNYPEQLIHGIFCAVDISYRVINSVERQIVGVTSGSTEFEVKNLKPYTLYAITVTPFTHEGKGKESDEAIARTSEGVPTSPPLNVKVFVNKSTEKLEVSWEPLPSEHRLGIILGYKITYVPQSGGNSRGMVVNTSSLSTELQNPPKGIPYVIEITAFNSVGEGPPSPAIVARSPEGVPSLAPPVVMAHSTSYTSVTVKWMAIPEENTNGIIMGHVVVVEEIDKSFYVCKNNFTQEIHGLEKSKVYKIKVASFTSKGFSNFSDYVTVITSEDDCHAIGMEDHNITESQITASSLQNGATNARLNFKPTNLLATGAWCAAPDDTSQPWLQIDFQDKVTLSQVAIQGRFYDGSAVSSSFFHWVEKYSLNYSLDGMYFKAYKQFDDVKIFQGNWDSNTVVFNSITPVIYTRYIRILPKSWEGNPCIRAEFFTCHKEITLEKVNVTSSVASSTGVGLQWKPPDTLKLGEHVKSYVIEIVDLLRGESFNYTVNSSMTRADLNILKPYTPYEFKVYGVTSSWEGNITDVISIKTQEDAPSEPPRNFSIKHSTESELTFQLKPVDKYHINGVLRGYKVTYGKSNSPNHTWTTLLINATHNRRRKRSTENETLGFILTNLESYSTYTVTVLAFTVKDGVPTLAANFTTAQDVPDHPPTNVTAFNTSSTSINVTWQPIPPDHTHGIILTYQVKYWRRDKPNDNVSNVTVNSTELQVKLKGLGKYKEYSIQVAGSTVVGLGNYSEAVFVRTEQDVPDEPPVNIRAKGIEPTSLKVHWSPVPYETVNGIGIGYKLILIHINGTILRNFTLNTSALTIDITDLEIWTNYTIKMTAFTVMGDGPWSDFIKEDTDEEAPFKPPANLTGEAKSSTSIFVQWSSLVLPNLRGILRGYTVYYKEAPSSVHPSVLKNVSVDISVTEVELTGLYKFTKYQIWATAFTTRDGLPSNSLFVTTQEDTPDRPPLYITYSAPSSTSLFVEWGAIPPQFENGIIRGFKIQFHEIPFNGTVEEREGQPLLRWMILDNLKKFTFYSIQVRAFTTEGYGPENSLKARTGQDVPSKPPQSITTESHVTLTTIPVAWKPIVPDHINGILLGYKIRYQAVEIGEESVEDKPIREQIVNSSTLSLVLTNLEIFILYRIDVVGFTIVGDGPPATDYAETCRCHKRLTTSWHEFQPYVRLSENGLPDGLIPPILSDLAVTCCETCQSHGKSYVDMNLNGFNVSAMFPSLRALRSGIENPTDFFFPVYGFKDQAHFAKQFGYQGIVESPGMAFIVNTNSQDNMPNAVLVNIASCWPAVMLALVITYLAGLVVWFVESETNPQDFPPSFIAGAYESFYWSFVSMTTVGYGDRAPITIIGRILAIVVILSGLIIFGIVNGAMATAITSVTMETDYKIYGTKVAAIEGSPEYRMGVRKNANMDKEREYHTFDDIYEALHERHVIGALIDTYSAGNNKDLFEQEHLRVNKILDYSATYGVVMGVEARKLRRCFKRYTERIFASKISHHIQKNTEQLKEPAEPLSMERSTGIFDSHSTVFQKTMYITIIWLTSFLFCGIIWEIIQRCRTRAKVTSHDSRQELRTELKGMVESFNENIRTIKKELASRHTRERKELLTSIEKQRGRKYLSSVELSELDNPYFEPEPDEQVSPKDKLDELVFSNDTPDKAELCCDERNEEHLPSNKYQTNC